MKKKSQCEQEIAETEADLARMREERSASGEEPKTEVQQLRARVAQLEEIQSRHIRRSEEVAEHIRTKAAKRQVGGCAEDVLPHRAGWLDDRQDMESASAITSLSPGARQDGEFRTTVRTLEHGAVRRVTGWVYRGIRVGEASHPGNHRLASSSLVHEKLLDSLQQDLLSGSRRRVRRRIRDNDSEDAFIRDGESPEVPSHPTDHEPDVWCWFHPRKWTQCRQQCLTVSMVPIV